MNWIENNLEKDWDFINKYEYLLIGSIKILNLIIIDKDLIITKKF